MQKPRKERTLFERMN